MEIINLFYTTGLFLIQITVKHKENPVIWNKPLIFKSTISQKTSSQLFFCEFYKMLLKSLFTEHIRVTVSLNSYRIF